MGGQKKRQTRGKGIKRGDKTRISVAERNKAQEKVKGRDVKAEKQEQWEMIMSSWWKRDKRQDGCHDSRTREVKCSGRVKKQRIIFERWIGDL